MLGKCPTIKQHPNPKRQTFLFSLGDTEGTMTMNFFNQEEKMFKQNKISVSRENSDKQPLWRERPHWSFCVTQN